MIKTKVNSIGMVFGYLTVIEQLEYKTRFGRVLCKCKCRCGNEKIIVWDNLKNNLTKSCGCYKKEEKEKKYSKLNTSIKSAEYTTWRGIKDRCYKLKNINYHNYGGRGILMCDRWFNSFECFYNDMGKRPSSKYSIERIDNDGNYEPLNCKWATREEQDRNRRTNVWIEYDNRKMILFDWAKELCVSRPNDIKIMIDKGVPFDEIYQHFKHKKQNNRGLFYEYKGQKMRQSKWAKILKLKYPNTISREIKKGKTFKEVYEKYSKQNR